MSGLYHKHFLKLLDFTPAELNSLLQLAMKLEADKRNGKEEARFTGKNIVLIPEKDSTRTRYSFEVAVYDQGAHVTYLGLSGSQIGHKESTEDTVRVLGHMYDGIQYRSYSQEIVETLAEYVDMPVWNGLISGFRPIQLLADLLAMQEYSSGKAPNEMTLVYVGDTCNNMDSPMPEAAALTGLGLCLIAPQACWSEAALTAERSALVQRYGGKITSTEDIASGVKGADFIYADVWVSTGEPREKWAGCIALLHDCRVNSKVMALTDNSQVKFLHCLPAFRDEQTMLGKKMAAEFGLYDGVEVADGVFGSPVSIVPDQAESRIHTVKAVMVATLAK